MNDREDKIKQLAALFALSRDAVLGVERGRVVFANAAAERLFAGDVRGESIGALLPELELSFCREGGVTSVTLAGERRTVAITRQGELAVLTIQHSEAFSATGAGALIGALRSAAFTLRFALDRLPGARADDENARLAWHSCYALQHRIGQLADAESLSRGELALECRTLDLAELVRNLVDSASFFTRERGTALACEIEPGDYLFRGDADRLEQLLLILLDNSLRHTSAGGSIRVSLRAAARQYILSVDDTGEGMDGEALAAAFRPGSAEMKSGAGLGLFIASELARAHGGAVLLQSEPGKGTHVRVTLPRGRDLCLRDAAPPSARGPERILTELSDVLPAEAYTHRYRE